jgi:aminopeptidase N
MLNENMKKILILMIFFCSEVAAQHISSNSGKIHAIAFSESPQYLNKLRLTCRTAASTNFDVKYYRCEWSTDPAVRFIKGCVTSYFLITSSGNNIVYDLSDSLHVDSVKQRNVALVFLQNNNSLQINFANLITAGSFDSVAVYYHGVPPNTGFGSFVNSIHNNVPIVWTLSEPYGSRDWWPCKNGLDDKADSIDVYITTPKEYSAVSNGLRQSEIISADEKTTHWKHRYPIASYLICMAVTNYSEFENHVEIGNTDLLMQTFCYPESLSLFQQQTPLVLASLQFFSKTFGPYPFIKEKYGQVQFGWGGGEEHQTSTFIVTPEEGLMSHELAHQWFGDKITCASWQDIWLNEGFATHLASMDMENKYPLTVKDTRKNEIENITSIPNGSVFVTDTTSVNRIFNSRLSYTKGSHLLYMLRWILSDSVFFKGMKSYFNDTSIAYGFAKTKDFQRNLEKVSGENLDYFFKDWFYGQGYPSYHVQWGQIDNKSVSIKMNQTTSDPSVTFFALPVALKFKNQFQQKTIVVDNKTNGETFIKDIGFIADTVIVDPDYWLITKNNTSEKINNIPGENVIQIFPSPFLKSINVNFRNFSETKAHLKIYDSKGSLMLKKDLQISNSLFYSLSTQTFAKGIYFIKIQTDNGVKFAKKIIRQ